MLVNCLLLSCDPNPTKCCSTVTVRNTTNTKARVIYDAKEVLSRLQTPIVQDPEVNNSHICPPIFPQSMVFLFVFLYEIKYQKEIVQHTFHNYDLH